MRNTELRLGFTNLKAKPADIERTLKQEGAARRNHAG